MIFLPIARRELRVAAAKRSTLWLRLAGAIVALLIGSLGFATGVEFWKTCLAPLNALFVSLVAGVFVSSISREAQRAVMGTVLFVGVWAGIGYLIDLFRGPAFFKLSSPVFVF